jgi:endonuclease YncB( thermonuclease family)
MLLTAASAAVAGHTLVVAAVHRGDVVELEGGWTTRLTGIRSPAPGEPFGTEAKKLTCRMVRGRRVAVFTWTRDNTAATIIRDGDGLPFAEILLGPDEDVDLAVELLERGLATVDEEHLPERLAHYRNVESRARAAGVGVWSEVASAARPSRGRKP